MNIMVAFLFICMVLGVWSKPKSKKLAPVVLVLAILMVLAFFVSPSHM